jgi:hypothetical protein
MRTRAAVRVPERSPPPACAQAQLTASTMAFGAGVKKLTVQAKQHKDDASFKHWLVGVWKQVGRSAGGQ